MTLTGGVTSLDPTSGDPTAHSVTIRDSKKSFYAEAMSTQGPGPFYSELNLTPDPAGCVMERGEEDPANLGRLLLQLLDGPRDRGFWISINKKENPPTANFRLGWGEPSERPDPPDDPEDPSGGPWILDVKAEITEAELAQIQNRDTPSSFHLANGTLTINDGRDLTRPNFGQMSCVLDDPVDVVIANNNWN